MGRRLFLRHLAEAVTAPPPEVTGIESPDEGVIGFQFSYAQDNTARECGIRLLATDVDEYPGGNTYMIYTADENVDPKITNSFEIINPVITGQTISDALAEISRALTNSLTRGQFGNPIELDADTQEVDEFDDDMFEGEDSDNDNFGLGDIGSRVSSTARPATNPRSRTSLSPSHVPIAKIKSDLRASKNAGFRVGVIGDLVTGGVVTVSVRVTKLGISEEAMEAWGLKRRQYIVLLIRFREGYRDLELVKEDTTLSDRTDMRVALCDHYKPTDLDAYDAFDQVSTDPKPNASKKSPPLEPLFIGRPLNDLLKERFARIVNFREACAFNWRSSEAFVNDFQGKAHAEVNKLNVDDYNFADESSSRALPSIVTADDLNGKLVKDASLPLVAMQFTLRHFVRCTEFCLVCHCKVEDTFEALKPYVCSKPLCLYQYMALGFGPSIEWELLSQPYVVDLLISFCYAAAIQGRLKDFPNGIDLRVPLLPHYNDTLAHYRGYMGGSVHDPKEKENQSETIQRSFTARLDFGKHEMILEPEQKTEATIASLRVGDWLVVKSKDAEEDYHYRVEDAMFPSFNLSRPITAKKFTAHQGSRPYYQESTPAESRASTPPKVLPKGIVPVDCYLYNESFDAMTIAQQQHAIITLLDVLPSVLDMREYLEKNQSGREPDLKLWRSRIPKSTLNLLRWIIASNRSCIMQVDSLAQEMAGSDKALLQTADARVSGMDNWMQFRFAQGAPDKEQRFVDCVKAESQAAGKKHPTLFAWHGSPISNWHSIIRQGLRYDETLHGRAYGHGVYMSNKAATSVGYAGMSLDYGVNGKGGTTWGQSVLKISNAFSLNEVVNMPEKFVSRLPHFVVKDIDWIQTRYLFVKSELKHTLTDKVAIEYEQDPSVQCFNESSKAIQIPITAVSKSRRPAIAQTVAKNGSKKTKYDTITDQETAEQQEDDANSVLSDDADRAFLDSDVDDDDDVMSIDGDEFYDSFAVPSNPAVPSKKRGLDSSNTDFVPGSLDVTNIKFLEAPKDASTLATKALLKAFSEAVKVQENTPLSKLGWYVDPGRIDNMYQWVIELHSFNEMLPLAKDMKKAGITSVVLEIRFTNQFPFSPPFIRVVKPRFLPFNQGGGGHVTEGGAICMELLTNSGWSAATSIESVLLQVQLAMCDEERPARLATSGNRFSYGGGRGGSYGVGEAVAAYERACRAHGWKIPEGFNKFAQEEALL